MKRTKLISITAMLTAVYFLLSTLIRIPIAGHITLDMGYIALTVAAVYLGAVPAMLVGALGAFLESALMAIRGVSPGWILMNALVGYACGTVLKRTLPRGKRPFIIAACLVIPISMLAGVVIKTLVDCLLYSIPIAAKVPSGIAAWSTDSLVMLVFGIPLSLALRKKIRL